MKRFIAAGDEDEDGEELGIILLLMIAVIA